MFSFLKLVVSELRARLGASKVEKILFLRLNKSSTYQIPGLGKIVREVEALKALQDSAAEAAFAAKTAVVAGNVSWVHKTDTHSMVSPCFSFCASLDSSEVGVRILWKGETRGGTFYIIVYETS